MIYSDRLRYIVSVALLVLFLTWVAAGLGWILHASMGWNFWVVFTVSCLLWAVGWMVVLWREERLYRRPLWRHGL